MRVLSLCAHRREEELTRNSAVPLMSPTKRDGDYLGGLSNDAVAARQEVILIGLVCLIVPKQNISLLAISSDVEAVGHLGVNSELGDGVVDPVVQGVELLDMARGGGGCVKEDSKESL